MYRLQRWFDRRATRRTERLSRWPRWGMSADDPAFLGQSIRSLLTLRREAPEQADRLLADAVPMMFAPLRQSTMCVHLPRIRLVGFLSASDISHTDQIETAEWLVEIAYRQEGDDVVRDAVVDLLSTTDQPHLLDALEHAFEAGFWHSSPPRLWTEDGRPTRFTRIVRANPHLPRPPAPDRYHGIIRLYWQGEPIDNHVTSVLIAALEYRPELIHDYRYTNAAAALLRGSSLANAPDEFTATCRQALLTLDYGSTQNTLCVTAIWDSHARGIVVEAGYIWGDPAAYLFLTEQWDRYDALDPDGTALRDYCTRGTAIFRRNIEQIARRTGRPAPCPPSPEPPLSSDSRSRSGGGSWPTNPGSASGGHSGCGGGGF